MFAASDLPPVARNLAASVIHRAWAWIATVGCVSPDDRLGRRFGRMGRASCIAFPPGAVFGERAIEIGEETLIGPFVSLAAGIPGMAEPPEGAAVIVIGARCTIGRGSSVVGIRRIEIGDDVAIGPNVYVTDHNHSYADITTPIAGQWPEVDPVRIGPGSWLGTGVIVLAGSDLGAHVTVAAGSVVRGSFPDFSVVAGNPARIVRRHAGAEGWVPPRRTTSVTPTPVTQMEVAQ